MGCIQRFMPLYGCLPLNSRLPIKPMAVSEKSLCKSFIKLIYPIVHTWSTNDSKLLCNLSNMRHCTSCAEGIVSITGICQEYIWILPTLFVLPLMKAPYSSTLMESGSWSQAQHHQHAFCTSLLTSLSSHHCISRYIRLR